MAGEEGTGKEAERKGVCEMNVSMMRRKAEFSFTDEELSIAAGKVREAMLKSLPEPEECKHEFSPEFVRKMEKLFAHERVRRRLREVRRWAAAILLLALMGGGAVLAVDTEARAALVEWVRAVYDEKVVYQFFGEQKEKALPVYELGWVPEGYQQASVYRDDTTCSALYQKGKNVNDSFIYQYGYVHKGTVVELLGEMSECEVKQVVFADKLVDIYTPLDKSENITTVWIDEESGVYFMVNGFLEESVMLHIIKGINLSNVMN